MRRPLAGAGACATVASIPLPAGVAGRVGACAGAAFAVAAGARRGTGGAGVRRSSSRWGEVSVPGSSRTATCATGRAVRTRSSRSPPASCSSSASTGPPGDGARPAAARAPRRRSRAPSPVREASTGGTGPSISATRRASPPSPAGSTRTARSTGCAGAAGDAAAGFPVAAPAAGGAAPSSERGAAWESIAVASGPGGAAGARGAG